MHNQLEKEYRGENYMKKSFLELMLLKHTFSPLLRLLLDHGFVEGKQKVGETYLQFVRGNPRHFILHHYKP